MARLACVLLLDHRSKVPEGGKKNRSTTGVQVAQGGRNLIGHHQWDIQGHQANRDVYGNQHQSKTEK